MKPLKSTEETKLSHKNQRYEGNITNTAHSLFLKKDSFMTLLLALTF